MISYPKMQVAKGSFSTPFLIEKNYKDQESAKSIQDKEFDVDGLE